MKNSLPITVTEVSGATFTSYKPFESTTEDLIKAGHEITLEDIETLKAGGTVVLISYNRIGTRTKRVLKAILFPVRLKESTDKIRIYSFIDCDECIKFSRLFRAISRQISETEYIVTFS